MLFTEPRVIAKPRPLGFFASYRVQEQADLRYGGQLEMLRAAAKRAPEKRAADTIPAPPTPPSR